MNRASETGASAIWLSNTISELGIAVTPKASTSGPSASSAGSRCGEGLVHLETLSGGRQCTGR